ncbi:hypothetical protein QYE76_061038 [Lolium multiflorum]|uniref:F-box domain-containing protein n=1 Tax=Lolium multiflorum TaxID=4521 RepID=A0AAD8W4V2_LOLMU|nr:hypothetical protein QYE76_061038 [Lolium multiflorum]
MDGDGETAPEPRYLPHELVSRILLRLPFKSLMRFTCVCKTWHSIITSDQSFQREHHRLQEPCVLIAPLIKSNDGGPFTVTNKKVTTPGLYRWEKSQSAATLVQAMDSFPAEEARHKFTHCNGLVLMPMAGTVRVLNPATRRLLVLPGRPHIVVPKRLSRLFREGGALGIGHDPRSNTYKVARFFYRYVDVPVTSGRNFTFGVEVFTIGRDTHWRETAVPPPHPIIAGQTASFLKGSLLWTIDESLLEGDVTVRGFLRFSLEDESFSVIGAPPGCPKLQYLASSLAEMGGELYLVHKVPANHTHLIWMTHIVTSIFVNSSCGIDLIISNNYCLADVSYDRLICSTTSGSAKAQTQRSIAHSRSECLQESSWPHSEHAHDDAIVYLLCRTSPVGSECWANR